MDSCVFCNYQSGGRGSILFQNEHCVCIEINDDVLVGSCIVIPKNHVVTMFDLSPQEWEATKLLADQAKAYLDEKYQPDGYNVGWNIGEAAGQEVFHAHMHIIPRHADEPLAGKGIRHWIKQACNKRA